MGAAIELFGAVYTTAGGTRYHADPACYALANGRDFHAARGGWDEGTSLYSLKRRSTISAVQFSYTACRVCVPPRFALPATGENFGHEPTHVPFSYDGERVCERCTERRRDHRGRWVYRPMPWPCTSAAVLGLVVIDADRWNARYPVGTPVTAYPITRLDEPLLTRTRTPAWRLGTGDSLVSVDGYAGGIALTHVDPRDGAR